MTFFEQSASSRHQRALALAVAWSASLHAALLWAPEPHRVEGTLSVVRQTLQSIELVREAALERVAMAPTPPGAAGRGVPKAPPSRPRAATRPSIAPSLAPAVAAKPEPALGPSPVQMPPASFTFSTDRAEPAAGVAPTHVSTFKAAASTTEHSAVTAPPTSASNLVVARARYVEAMAAKVRSHRHYPYLARRRGLEGTVCVRVSLRPSGQLQALSITCGNSLAALVEAAERAVKASAPFDPLPAGTGLSLVVDLPIVFRLEDQANR